MLALVVERLLRQRTMNTNEGIVARVFLIVKGGFGQGQERFKMNMLLTVTNGIVKA